MNIKSALIRFWLISAICLMQFALAGQNPVSWQAKVHQTVFEELSRRDQVEVIIEMREQANVSAARWMRTKAEKGRFVFETLKRHAQITQQPVVEWLNSRGLNYSDFYIVNAIRVTCTLSDIEYLANREEVGKIQFCIPLNSQQIEKSHTSGDRNPESVEWGVEKIHADDVWALGYNGSGIVIGGQDTGYDWDHEALIDSYRGWNGSTADHNYNWHDAIHQIDPGNSGDNPCGLDLSEPCDDHSHGTHTMGTMTGTQGGNGIGVAPGAQWIGCRNMERGDGTPATYLECFQWFLAPTDLNGENPMPLLAPHVINNSWACPPSEGCDSGYDFGIMELAITNLKTAGIAVVASAGNEGSSCSTVQNPPAFYEASFSVGATNSSDAIASFSSRGPSTYQSDLIKPNVSAPGVSVYSSTPGDNYATFSGTSMAGPHVAGAIALLISAVPELEGDVAQIESILESSAVPLTSGQSCGGVSGSDIPNNTFGHGRIDVLAAVNMALESMPLEFLYLEVKSIAGGNLLKWAVSNRDHEDHFIIERSASGKKWEPVGSLPITSQSEYEYLDPGTFSTVLYYRLKMVDTDGQFNYSRIVNTSLDDPFDIRIFPNPLKKDHEFQVQIPYTDAPSIQIRVFDCQGKLKFSAPYRSDQNGLQSHSVSTSSLEPGIYVVEVSADNQAFPIYHEKLIIH